MSRLLLEAAGGPSVGEVLHVAGTGEEAAEEGVPVLPALTSEALERLEERRAGGGRAMAGESALKEGELERALTSATASPKPVEPPQM